MIIAYYEKIIQIWMITDGQKSSIFGTGPYLPQLCLECQVYGITSWSW